MPNRASSSFDVQDRTRGNVSHVLSFNIVSEEPPVLCGVELEAALGTLSTRLELACEHHDAAVTVIYEQTLCSPSLSVQHQHERWRVKLCC